MTIEDRLRFHAASNPEKTALKCEGGSYSYSALYDAVCRKAAALGNVKGTLVPIVATPDFDFLVSYFAIHLAGAVAVPLGKDLPPLKRQQLIETFSGKAAPEGVADLLYTTGTTGQAKAVLVSHGAIVADAENLVEAQHYDADLTFIINGPLNHIGSLSKIYPVVYTGGTLQLADGMKDLNRFFAMVDDAGSKVATFLVPASIRMLLTFAKDKLASYAHKIDFIETGAAPMPQEDMQRLCQVLPQTRLYNTYASTETGIMSTYDYNDGECIAGCLGKPMRHSAFFITEDGTVACCGKTLMKGYWNDADATAKVLQGDAVVTADLGTIDGQGRLRLQGRSDDVINVGGYKIAPTEIESVALAFPGVKDCICTESPHPVMGKVLALLVVPDDAYNRRDLIACLKANLEPHKLPLLYREVTEVRRTFNGKIDRKSYR